MLCKLTSAASYPIKFTKDIPPSLLALQLPAINRYVGKYTNGEMLFQCLEDDSDCSIWHNTFRLNDNDTLETSCPGPALVLRISLRRLLYFRAGDLGAFQLAPQQAVLFYQPKPNSDLYLRGGSDYHVMDIVMPEKYMQHFLPYHSILEAFTEKMRNRLAASLTTFPIRMSAALLHVIDKLLSCGYMGSLRSMFVDARLMDIMTEILSIAGGSNRREVLLSEEEVERIHELRKMLGKNLHLHYRIRDLAKIAFMNEYKLKRGFQQIVGASIFDYQLNQRMQEAQKQLQETNMLLEDIAEATGYQHLSSFINAFRQHFGITPAAYRKSGSR